MTAPEWRCETCRWWTLLKSQLGKQQYWGECGRWDKVGMAGPDVDLGTNPYSSDTTADFGCVLWSPKAD